MKSLVVFGGAILVAGSSIAGMLQMNKADNQSAGFLSFFSGEETGRNVRPPVWSLRHVKPGSQTARKDPATKPVQPVKVVKIAKVSQAPEPQKKSIKDVSTRKLVAALRGEKSGSGKRQEPVADKNTKKPRALNEDRAAKKLVENIRKKAEIAAKKQQARMLESQKLEARAQQVQKLQLAKAKKNITYENKQRSPRSLVSGKPQPPIVVMPKLAIRQKPKIKKTETQVAVLTKRERTELGKLVKQKKLPSIDLTIEFDYKSAKLTAQALPQLARIGAALTDGQLAKATFVIAGHTDSVGGNKYNMGLSSKRAQTVLDYLKDQFKISGKRLLAVGYGEERLKNAQKPKAAENRRVELITLVR